MIVQTAAVVSLAVLAAGVMALATAPAERGATRADRLAILSASGPEAITVERRSSAFSTLVRVPMAAADRALDARPAPEALRY